MDGLLCCDGVPYPPEGICSKDCNLDSDRAIKEAVRPIDRKAIAESLRTLEVGEWSYKREPGVRHVGPMAQDFRAKFGLGADEKTINPVDAIGVTMVAVKALQEDVRALEKEVASLRRENERLRREKR